MKLFQTNIRGAFFRPPAKEILANLPTGHKLRLQAEPENLHDAFAVAVYVDSSTLPRDEDLIAAVAARGITDEGLFSTPSWHLAYVERAKSNNCEKIYPFLDKIAEVSLCFNGLNSQPMAKITFSEEVEFAEGTS